MESVKISQKKIAFSDLYKVITSGSILRDCEIRCVDKQSNVMFDQTAIFATRRLDTLTLGDSRIVGVIVTPELSTEILTKTNLGVWECNDPQDTFFSIHEFFVNTNFVVEPWDNKISSSAIISPHAIIGEHSVSIGDDCVIEDGAVIHPYSVIGNSSRIGSLCDIGSDGFEVHCVKGKKKVIKHGGLVIIGNNVEIMQMTKIARGLSPAKNTEIRDNVKVDSLTHIAHGVVVERDTIITGGVTIAGNTHICEGSYIGPGSIISNRLYIGKNAYVSIGSVVISNLKKGTVVSGNFAVDHQENLSRHQFLKNQIKISE